ncbi:hypothetical protein BJY52DRAFT_415084 [Lactarius psammicola]|nr:hypothetical protein BJY52DRAFT_415084 [Lactarius psammicola]
MSFEEMIGTSSCSHISTLFRIWLRASRCSRRFAAQSYRKHNGLRTRFIPQNGERQVAFPICGTCELAMPHPFVCLECAFSGCWQDEPILEHLTGVYMQLGIVYCKECHYDL